jgi:hypothetical protein
MSFQKPIEVNFNEFYKAVVQLPGMKRAPGGKKGGHIPTDTLLTKDREGLMVETSVISTYVPANKPWQIQVSVDAKLLLERCRTLEQIGAKNELIEIGIKDKDLLLKFKTTTFSLPTLWVDEDPQYYTAMVKRMDRLRG